MNNIFIAIISPTMTLLNVLNVLNVLKMPKDPSLACWLTYYRKIREKLREEIRILETRFNHMLLLSIERSNPLKSRVDGRKRKKVRKL